MFQLDSSSLVSRRKNILLVVRWPVGGIRTYLKYLLRNLSNGSYKFYILTTSEAGSEFLWEDVKDLIDGYMVVKHQNSVERKIAIDVFRAVKKFNIELIHAHGFTSLVCVLPSSYLFRLPLILTSHDVINSRQFDGYFGFLKRNVLQTSLNRCSVVQSVSLDAERNLISFFPELSDRSLCVENGIDVDRFFSASIYRIRDELGIPQDTVIVGFFGRFMNQKGFSFLIEAIRILKENQDFNFQVVCFGSGAFIREEQIRIEEYGLESLFSFYNAIPDVASFMKGCDLVVMPSLWEACGLVAMEALSAGVPLVGSDCIGLREVLEGTPAIKVTAGNAESLADGMVRCVKVGKKPFEDFAPLACERFDVRQTAMKVSKIYQDLIG